MHRESDRPALRFKGFEEEWEEKKLGELADIVGGGTPSTSIPDFWDGIIDWYAPAEIGNQTYLTSSQQKITEKGYLHSSAKMLPIGTVLFTSRAGIGKSAILKKEGCTNQGFQSIVPQPEKLDSYFIYARTAELKKYGETVGAGSTFLEVSGKQMADIDLLIPPTLAEQQRIGVFFSHLDLLLSLQNQKLEKLQSFKKAMLDKMFPQKGSKVPEIRFRGFAEPWKEQKASFLFASTADKGYPELPVLSATQDRGMVRRDQNNINIFHNEENEKGYKRVLPGQFVIHLRSFQGGFAYSAIEGITSPAYTVFGLIEPDKHCSQFWKYIFSSESFIKRLETVTYGIRDGRSISYDEFLTLSFLFPSKEEETKIAQYLDSLDRLISLNQQKLNKLQSLKKAMLGQMFPPTA